LEFLFLLFGLDLKLVPFQTHSYGVIKLGDEIDNGILCLRTSNVRWLNIETEGIKKFLLLYPIITNAQSFKEMKF
jgi:hypothetical protein